MKFSENEVSADSATFDKVCPQSFPLQWGVTVNNSVCKI